MLLITFPAPASSNAACGFPALRFPACFTSRVMRPIASGALSQQPPATGPGSHRTVRASHAASSYSTSSNQIPGVSWRASYAAVSSSPPSCEHDQNTGSNAQSRSSNHPPAQDRVDDLHHPSHRLRSIASEYLLEPLRNNALRVFICGLYWGRHTPRRLRTRRNSNPRNPKLSPFAKSTVRLLSSPTTPYGGRCNGLPVGVPIPPAVVCLPLPAASHAADRRPQELRDHPPSARIPHTCTALHGSFLWPVPASGRPRSGTRCSARVKLPRPAAPLSSRSLSESS